jgi:hypothetical protein
MHTILWWVLVKETDEFEQVAVPLELHTGRPRDAEPLIELNPV